MKRLTEYTIPETGFSVVSEEKYKRILMEEKPSVEKVYNRLKKIEDILGDEYDLDEISKIVRCKNCVYMVGRAEFPGEYYCKILADTVPFDGFCHRGKAALKAREQK